MRLIKAFDKIHKRIATMVSAFATLLVLLICLDVLLRYSFNLSFIIISELEWYIFSALFLLGLSYTYKTDSHVRVDVLYGNFSEKNKKIINRLGILFFLIPFCLLVIFYSSKYTFNSWVINESSPEADGLPWRFLVKAMIPIGYFMLLIQAFVLFIKPSGEE